MDRATTLRIGVGVSVLTLVLVYFQIVTHLVSVSWQRPEFLYCNLVPLVLAFMVWQRREVWKAVPANPSWLAVLALLGSSFFLLMGELGGEFLSLSLSLWLAIIGLTWALAGWGKLKTILFPLCFMLVAFPPPSFFYNKIKMVIGLVACKLAGLFWVMLGVPAFQEGNAIDLGFFQYEVNAQTMGLPFIVPLIPIAILLAYYFRAALWKRLLLALFVFPIVLSLNGLRVGLEILMSVRQGVDQLEASTRLALGLSQFLAAVAVLLLVRLALAWLPPRGFVAGRTMVKPSGKGALPVWGPVLACLCLLLLTAGFIYAQKNAEHIYPQVTGLDDFPTEIDGWKGRNVLLSKFALQSLDLTDYVNIDYRGPDGKNVALYLAWYASQSKGKSIHSPETCLVGSGWRFERSRIEEVLVPGLGSIRVNNAVMEKQGQRILAYFWFSCRGRTLASAYELKIYNLIDSIFMKRTDGALVRLTTALYPGENEHDAELRLQELLALALPKLEAVLPGKELK